MLLWIYVLAPIYFITSGKKGGIVPFHSSFGNEQTCRAWVPKLFETMSHFKFYNTVMSRNY